MSPQKNVYYSKIPVPKTVPKLSQKHENKILKSAVLRDSFLFMLVCKRSKEIVAQTYAAKSSTIHIYNRREHLLGKKPSNSAISLSKLVKTMTRKNCNQTPEEILIVMNTQVSNCCFLLTKGHWGLQQIGNQSKYC